MRGAAKRYGQGVPSHHLRPLLLLDRKAEEAEGRQARMGFRTAVNIRVHQPIIGMGGMGQVILCDLYSVNYWIEPASLRGSRVKLASNKYLSSHLYTPLSQTDDDSMMLCRDWLQQRGLKGTPT